MKSQDRKRLESDVMALSPKSLQRLKRVKQKAAGTVLEAPESGLSGRQRIGRVPQNDVEITANIRFAPMSKDTARKLRRDEDPKTRVRLSNAGRIDGDVIDALRQAEPALLDWIAENEKNAVLFALDPLTALAKSGVKLDNDLLRRIRLIRRSRDRPDGHKPPVTVTRVTVAAKNKKVGVEHKKTSPRKKTQE